MIKLMKTLFTVGISAGMVVATLLPAQAMPVAAAPASGGQIDLVQWGPPGGGPGYYGQRPGYGPGPGYRRPPPPRPGYYNGHRGYRQARPGYRYHNGYWFPLAAFAAGAIIGGAMSAPSRPAAPSGGGINPKHYDWCFDRYRSYDARSNTFQPNYGPRQQCLSPYY